MDSVALLILLVALAGVALVAVVVGLVVTGRRKPAPLPETHSDVLTTPPADPEAPTELSAPPATLEPEVEPGVEEPAAPVLERPEGTASRLVRLRQRLAGSQGTLGRGLLALLSRDRLDEDTWESIEDTLLTADIGVAPTQELVERLRTRLRVEGEGDPRTVLREELVALVDPDLDRRLQVSGEDGTPGVVLVVGVNGAGKTSVLNLVSGAVLPHAGRVKHGRTVRLAHLTQAIDEVDPEARVLATVEDIRRVSKTLDGKEMTATSLLERFGFTGDRLTARLGDLSGGERRRFQLLKLLLDEPNVLLLDEPTNDLDIETLTVLEDFLDGWPGTLVVVSHDRYFLERVTDSTWALLGDGQISMLPGGVEEYLERRAALLAEPAHPSAGSTPAEPAYQHAGSTQGGQGGQEAPAAAAPKAKAGSAEERAARKTLARLDKRLERIAAREAELNALVLEHASDHQRLAEISAELGELSAEKDEVEMEWLEAAEAVE